MNIHNCNGMECGNSTLIETMQSRIDNLSKALTNLRQAQKNYIAWTRQAQLEPDYAEERERLGKLVGKAAKVADQVLSREVKEVNDEHTLTNN